MFGLDCSTQYQLSGKFLKPGWFLFALKHSISWVANFCNRDSSYLLYTVLGSVVNSSNQVGLKLLNTVSSSVVNVWIHVDSRLFNRVSSSVVYYIVLVLDCLPQYQGQL